MKMLYSVLAVCVCLLTSCLGDTNTHITVGMQEAVYQTTPQKGFYIKDGRFLYGNNVSVGAEEGDCFLIEYSFDSSSSELRESDSLSIELLRTVDVPLWKTENQLIDTTTVYTNEVLTESFLVRNAFINNRLFLWSNHRLNEALRYQFLLSYDAANMYTTVGDKRVYPLYLRVMEEVSEDETEDVSTRVLATNAFQIEEFYNQAKTMEQARGEQSLYIVVRYVSGVSGDGYTGVWNSTEPIEILFDGSLKE